MPGGQAAVIAMGRLGGREMTAASDLDLIVVYDFDANATMSRGTKPLAGGQYYTRFTQRLISALTAPTAEGSLYEVDMRLRPSGHAGPVATHVDSFIDYQKNHAWTWEHLALTRARVVAGPPELRETIERTIAEVLSMPRERAKIARDVLEMRAKIEKEKGTQDIWDIKQVRGGLVDLEFIAQFLQVVNAGKHPEILDQSTLVCLTRLAETGLLSEDDAAVLIPAARLYHNLTQLLRLCLDKPFDPETASADLQALLARAAGQPDFAALERHLAATLKGVQAAFERLVA
jgi:glutamate-ammonia-ligase adenylyltransferase